MGKKKRKSINISEIFENKNDNEFLLGLENWIIRKIPPAFDISEDDFKKNMKEIDVICEDIRNKGLEPELEYIELSQALNIYMPNSTPVPEGLFNFYENIFLAVFYMDTNIYNNGADNYFLTTDENGYRYTLEGLSIIGAVDVKEQLELLCLSVFGENYPKTENEIADLLDEGDEIISLLLDKFCRFYAKKSDMVNNLLAKWARENKNMFL